VVTHLAFVGAVALVGIQQSDAHRLKKERYRFQSHRMDTRTASDRPRVKHSITTRSKSVVRVGSARQCSTASQEIIF
jgi:hypothetical protein